MMRYINFILLTSSLLCLDAYAGGGGPNTGSEKEGKQEKPNQQTFQPTHLSYEELLNLKNELLVLVDNANDGNEDAQNFVAQKIHQHEPLHQANDLQNKIDLSKWKNLGDRATKDVSLACLVILLEGKGAAIDQLEIIFKSLKNDCDNSSLNDAEKFLLVAHCYQNGIGVSRDKKLAIEFFQKSADLGSHLAMNRLGFKYLTGENVDKDEKEAFKWYQKSADLGYDDAMNNLGICYNNGIGVARNEKEAIKWYQKSAELGNSYAMKSLGTCYYDGLGVDKDWMKALSCYLRSWDLSKYKYAADMIKGMLSVYSTSCAYRLYDELVSWRYVGEKSDLGVLVGEHFYEQKLNEKNSGFKKTTIPLQFLYDLHQPIATFTGGLLEFLTKITRNEAVKDSNFKLPYGFMITNLAPNDKLLESYETSKLSPVKAEVPKGLEWINEPHFSIFQLGEEQFFNVGHQSVKLAHEFETIMSGYDVAFEKTVELLKHKTKVLEKSRVDLELLRNEQRFKPMEEEKQFLASLPKREEFIKLCGKEVETLKAHKQFLEKLPGNLGDIFRKTAPQRGQDFLDYLEGR